jgi:ribosome biogenesis protein ERB1
MSEVQINCIGDVPEAWYRQLSHIGYNGQAQRLSRTTPDDSLSALLVNIDDRSSWRKIVSKLSGDTVKLSSAEVVLLQRIQAGNLPTNPNEILLRTLDQSSEGNDRFHQNEPKRRFQPSKWEAKTVTRLVRALRSKFTANKTGESTDRVNRDIWGIVASKGTHMQTIRARKGSLPGNQQSYNPPAEYMHLLGKAIESTKMLRQVHAYSAFVQEQFERCLDLYLCPRSNKNKVNMAPDDLLPQLPEPQQLRPFPEVKTQTYAFSDTINSLSLHWSGEWVACSEKSGEISVWEVQSGKRLKRLRLREVSSSISWHPTNSQGVIAICAGTCVLIWRPFDEKLSSLEVVECELSEKSTGEVTWEIEPEPLQAIIRHSEFVTQVEWHPKGNYIATVFNNDSEISLHNFHRKSSHQMFSKQDSKIVGIVFHPSKPLFLIGSRRTVRIYNLRTQELQSRFSKGMSSNTCISITKDGASLLVGSENGKFLMYDVESPSHCKMVRAHSTSISSITCHNVLPLIATLGRDGNTNIFNLNRPSALDTDPVILPLKSIKSEGTDIYDSREARFHPTQPWIFLQNKDCSIELFSERRM